MKDVESYLRSKGYQLIEGQWFAPSRLPPTAKQKSGVEHEPMAAQPGKVADPVRRSVFIKSYRCRLVDRDGVWVSYLIDTLTRAGLLFDDTPAWLERIEVDQIKVSERRHERTEVIIV